MCIPEENARHSLHQRVMFVLRICKLTLASMSFHKAHTLFCLAGATAAAAADADGDLEMETSNAPDTAAADAAGPSRRQAVEAITAPNSVEGRTQARQNAHGDAEDTQWQTCGWRTAPDVTGMDLGHDWRQRVQVRAIACLNAKART
jgi:hypothetical protein